MDVALKALSPGIYDTTTAASCVDYLGALIFHLGTRHIPPRQRCHESRLRLVSCSASYESIVDESFHEIRQHARNNVAIYVKLLAAIEKAVPPNLTAEKLNVLWHHTQLVTQTADLEIKQTADRALISGALMKTASKLEKDSRPLSTNPSNEATAFVAHGSS